MSVLETQKKILTHELNADLIVNGVFKYKVSSYGDYNKKLQELIAKGLRLYTISIRQEPV